MQCSIAIVNQSGSDIQLWEIEFNILSFLYIVKM